MPFSLTVCVESMLFLFEMEFPSYESIGISNIVQTIQYIERQIRSYQLVANCWSATRVVVKLLSNSQIVMENCNVSVLWCASAQATSLSSKPEQSKKNVYMQLSCEFPSISRVILSYLHFAVLQSHGHSIGWHSFPHILWLRLMMELLLMFYHSLLLLLLSS